MIKSTICWSLFVMLSVGLASYGLWLGLAPGLVLFIQGASVYGICLVMESITPYRYDWQWINDRNVVADIGHALLFDRAIQVLTPFLTVMIFSHWQTPNTQVQTASFAILLGVFYIELSEYWRHRFLHFSDRFWPIHAIHHHLDRMHIFRSGRVHFMDGVARVLVTFLPALLLGIPVEAITWWMILVNATGPISHSNLDIITPCLINKIVATPMVHRVHHASHDAFMGHNLAPTFPVIDILFNTWLAPEDNPVTEVGVEQDGVPGSFMGQLAHPFPFMFGKAVCAEEYDGRDG